MNIDFEKEIGSITAQIIEKYKPEKIILFARKWGQSLTLDKLFGSKVSGLRAVLKAAYLAGESPAPGIAYLPG